METIPQYKSYGRRWLILIAILPIIISTELCWLSFAPISSIAESFYNVSGMEITLLAMSYMIMFIVFSIPASYVVDRFGYRASLITGAIITAVFCSLRAVFATDFTMIMICQFVLAIGQPFLLNISTKVPANWFPMQERSTATGILTMAQYLGFVVPMVLSPLLAQSGGIQQMLTVYAVISVVSALLCILCTREHPPIAPGPPAPKEDFSIAALKNLFKSNGFRQVLILSFISMGIFNTLLSMIESILTPRGITIDQAGIIGAVFVIFGIIGAVVLPLISDRLGKRTPLFVIGIALLVPLYLGIALIADWVLVAIVAGITGFTIMGIAPILFQHGAEIAYPIQEGTSLGLILMMGQISGIIFLLLFEALSGAIGVLWPMLIMVAATALQIPITLRMKESKLLRTQ